MADTAAGQEVPRVRVVVGVPLASTRGCCFLLFFAKKNYTQKLPKKWMGEFDEISPVPGIAPWGNRVGNSILPHRTTILDGQEMYGEKCERRIKRMKREKERKRKKQKNPLIDSSPFPSAAVDQQNLRPSGSQRRLESTAAPEGG